MAEPVPEPQSAWKARIRLRVADAVRRLEVARGKLDSMPPHLVAPIRVADAAAARNRIQFLLESFKAVSHHLVVFSALAHAAEIFALHAGSDDPTQPLPYIHLLGAQEQALQSALTKLSCSGGRALDAYRSVECCRGHLVTALHLLDHPGLPDVDALIDRERGLACTALEDARSDTLFCVTQVGLARQDMAGAN